MPVISQFYGIIIQMFFKEKGQHHQKHIHIKCMDIYSSRRIAKLMGFNARTR